MRMLLLIGVVLIAACSQQALPTPDTVLADYYAWCKSAGGVVKTFPVGIMTPRGNAPAMQHICVEAETNKGI